MDRAKVKYYRQSKLSQQLEVISKNIQAKSASQNPNSLTKSSSIRTLEMINFPSCTHHSLPKNLQTKYAALQNVEDTPLKKKTSAFLKKYTEKLKRQRKRQNSRKISSKQTFQKTFKVNRSQFHSFEPVNNISKEILVFRKREDKFLSLQASEPKFIKGENFKLEQFLKDIYDLKQEESQKQSKSYIKKATDSFLLPRQSAYDLWGTSGKRLLKDNQPGNRKGEKRSGFKLPMMQTLSNNFNTLDAKGHNPNEFNLTTNQGNSQKKERLCFFHKLQPWESIREKNAQDDCFMETLDGNF